MISIALICSLILLPAYIVGIIVTSYYKSKREEKEIEEVHSTIPQQAENTQQQENAHRSSLQIILDTLQSLNCQYKKVDEEDGGKVIYFRYQAENFHIHVDDEHLFCRLVDPLWHTFEADDFNELSLVKKTINNVNWLTPLSLVYTKSEDGQQYNIHTCYNMLVDDCIPYPDFFINILNDFFATKHAFYRMLAEEHGREDAK